VATIYGCTDLGRTELEQKILISSSCLQQPGSSTSHSYLSTASFPLFIACTAVLFCKKQHRKESKGMNLEEILAIEV
jgi:hypothetical protein